MGMSVRFCLRMCCVCVPMSDAERMNELYFVLHSNQQRRLFVEWQSSFYEGFFYQEPTLVYVYG